ncbi:MAG: hypothetical protein HY738_24545, partial [Bacteroidia bacterium]|nr:hypothetical protein [Bacteroidia bacterium]
ILTKKRFEEFFNSARNQFLLKDSNFIYYLVPKSKISYNDEAVVAHNETKGTVDIVYYKDVIEVIVDKQKFVFG